MADIPSSTEILQEAVMARPEATASPLTAAGKEAAKIRADQATKGAEGALQSQAEIFKNRNKPEGLASGLDKKVEQTAQSAIESLLTGDEQTNAQARLNEVLAFAKKSPEEMTPEQIDAVVENIKAIVESSDLLNQWLVREGGDPESLKHFLEDPQFRETVKTILKEKFDPENSSWQTDEDIEDALEPKDIRDKTRSVDSAEEEAQKIKDAREDREREKGKNTTKLEAFEGEGERVAELRRAEERLRALSPKIEAQKQTYERNLTEYQRILDGLPKGRNGNPIYPPAGSAIDLQMKSALDAAKEVEAPVLEYRSMQGVVADFHKDRDHLLSENERIDREQRASKIDLDTAEDLVKERQQDLDKARKAEEDKKAEAAAKKGDPKEKLTKTLDNIFLEAADRYFGDKIATFEKPAKEAADKRAADAQEVVDKRIYQSLAELYDNKDRKGVIRRKTMPGNRATEYMNDLKDITKGPDAVLEKILIRQGFAVDAPHPTVPGRTVRVLSPEGKKMMDTTKWKETMRARVALDVVKANLINGAYKKSEMSGILSSPWFAEAIGKDDSPEAKAIRAKIDELKKKDGKAVSTAKWLNDKSKSPLGLGVLFMLLGPVPLGAWWLANKSLGGGGHAPAHA